MSLKKILINVFHPRMEQSRGNQAMLDAVRDLPNVTIRDQYAEYPDFKIDAAKEQEILLEHDVIVFQFPLFWLSTPSLMKEWQDTVLTKGFAFPPGEGDQLAGKIWQTATTTGGPDEGYTREGPFKANLDDIFIPLRLTATYSSMEWKPVFAIGSVMPEDDAWMRAATAEELDKETARYRALLESF